MSVKFERSIFTPLGFRFWDPVRDVQVRHGLNVTARLADPLRQAQGIALRQAQGIASRPVVRAFRTASGIYAFQGLQGLRELEYPLGEVLEASLPDTKQFIIEVKDDEQRFLPLTFTVELPLPYRGIYRPNNNKAPPENTPPCFYLFSAPTRSALSGLAVVHAHLVERESERPAAHAILMLQVSGQTWYGIADERGVVVVPFPYPPFLNGSSGLSGHSLPTWNLTIRVCYAPSTQTRPVGCQAPDLRSIHCQPEAEIWPTEGGSVTEWSSDLIFGQQLVLRTDNRSTLWVRPVESPP